MKSLVGAGLVERSAENGFSESVGEERTTLVVSEDQFLEMQDFLEMSSRFFTGERPHGAIGVEERIEWVG